MSGGTKKTAVKSTVIFAVSAVVLLSVAASRVMAFDLVKTVQNITQSIFQHLPDFTPEPQESEFLLSSEYKDFKAYFGDRKNNGRHRVKILKDKFSIDFSFLEATLIPQRKATESGSLSNPSDLGDLGNLDNLSAFSSTQSSALQNAEHASISADLAEQLKSIDEEQASIAAELEKAKEDVASIDKFLQKTVPGTQIGFDEISKTQMVVKNDEVQKDLDIYYWKRANDLREKIIIRELPPPSQISFEISTENLTPVDLGAGVIYFKDKDGEYQIRLTKGYIKDLTGAFSNKVDTKIKDGKLIHVLDETWLSDPKRVFPLTLYFNFQMVETPAIPTPSPTPEVTPVPPSPINPIELINPSESPVSTPTPLPVEATPSGTKMSPTVLPPSPTEEPITPTASPSPTPSPEATP